MTETVLFEKDGPIARLVLNNPSRHNSLGEEELRALQQYIASVEADPELRVLIVTGSGDKTFCAGAALNQLGAGEISGDLFQETTDLLAAVPIPTLCALNGSVYGGGTELALSCDFRVGIEGTRLRVPAARIGLCYPISGINRFVQRLGVNIAKRILVGAEEFDADAMLRIGFLDHLVPAAELETKVNGLAHSMAQLAPLAVRSMKVILQQAAAGAIDLDEARALAQTCADSEDLQEGFSAQRERREPVFKGR